MPLLLSLPNAGRSSSPAPNLGQHAAIMQQQAQSMAQGHMQPVPPQVCKGVGGNDEWVGSAEAWCCKLHSCQHVPSRMLLPLQMPMPQTMAPQALPQPPSPPLLMPTPPPGGAWRVCGIF